MRRQSLLTVAFIGLLAAAGLALREPVTRALARPARPAAAVRAEVDPTSREVRELGTQVQALRAQVELLQAALVHQSTGTKPTAEDRTTAPEGWDAPTALSPEESSALRAAHLAEVETSFRNEARTAAWASERRSEIQAAAKGRAFEHALGDVECRTDTCRVEVTDNRTSDFAKDLPVFLQKLGAALPTVEAAHFPRSDGSIKLVLYMSRLSAAPADP